MAAALEFHLQSPGLYSLDFLCCRSYPQTPNWAAIGLLDWLCSAVPSSRVIVLKLIVIQGFQSHPSGSSVT